MKFTLPRESLLVPLQQVIGVIEKRQTLPILSNVRMKLDEGRLELTGTDLEVQLITWSTAETSESGSTTVPARKLFDLLRLLPEKSSVDVECQENRFTLRCGDSRFLLNTLPVENYPEFDTNATDFETTLPIALLREAIDKTTFAMANQDVRYYLNGLLLEVENTTVRTVASDGHRLALFEAEIEEAESPSTRQIIIPRKGVTELARLLDESEETATLQFVPNTLRVHLDTAHFAVKLIDGRYPDYRRVMPHTLTKFLEVDKSLFKGALTRVSVLSSEKQKALSLEADESGIMTLKSQNPEQEEAEERLPIALEGDSVHVGFNAGYLLDAVNHITSEQVKLSFPDGATSCLIEDPNDSRFKFIVMPMRL